MEKQLSIWKEQRHPVVTMHNHLISAHFGYLDLSEIRIFLLMLAKLKFDTEDLKPIRIKVTDVMPNYKGGDHFDRIVSACDELKRKMKDVKMIWEVDSVKSYKSMTVIDSVSYIQNTDYIEANFGVAIRPVLINLKGNFTQAELKELLELKSSYSIRMFMLMKSLYRERQVLRITVDDFKRMLGDITMYPEYKIFKRDVIKKTQTQLAKTSAAFNFDEEKENKIRTLKFIPINTQVLNQTPLSDDLNKKFAEYKVTTTRILELFEKKEITEAYMRFCIERVVKEMGKGKVKKAGGLIHSYIVDKHLWNDFQLNTQKPAYKPVLKPQVISAAIATFLSESELKEIHKAGYESAVKVMLNDGYFWAEKNGIRGLGMY